jgi:hypothetical protein
MKIVEQRGEVFNVELAADKGGRGRGWSAAHVEVARRRGDGGRLCGTASGTTAAE